MIVLDAIEAEAGLRDLSQIDTYAFNGITLALNTNTEPFWGVNATFGENYWDRPADRRFDQIRNQLRPLFTADNPTAAAGQWLACLERCETIETHWLAIAIVEQALASVATAATIRADY